MFEENLISFAIRILTGICKMEINYTLFYLVFIILIDVVYGKRKTAGEAKYEPTWLSSLTPCSDLDAKQFDASNLVLRKESPTVTVLSGDFETLQDIPEGIEIKLTVEKDTPLGKEFMYLIEDDFCSHLAENDRPWSPFFDAFNLETRACPIPAKKYSLGDIRLDLGFADHVMTKEFVGEYVATIVLEHPGLDLAQGSVCMNMAIGIEEIRDEAE